MALTMRPMLVTDFIDIELQENQRSVAHELLDPEIGFTMLSRGPCYSFINRNDKIVAITGLEENVWNNSAVCWGLLSAHIGRDLGSMVKHWRKWLETAPYQRLEIYVDLDFVAGHRFANLLGFTLEGVRRCYKPDGADQAFYSIINPEKVR